MNTMKTFIAKSSFFILLVGVSIYFVFTRADGYTDAFYIRFTTPKQKNLIIGTSRAAQGLQPKVFEEVMNVLIFNYSFTIGQSPFGSTYLESIKRKLDPTTSNGLFIITVDPWSISSKSNNPNDSSKFRERNRCLGNTRIVDMNPNPFYILNNISDKYYKLLYAQQSHMFLHDDGWLEVSVKMDSSSVEKRIERKMQIYREKNLPAFKFSSIRLEYLIKIIQYLDGYGKVYLVRLPVHPRMMEIENHLMPDFESKLQEAKCIASGYLDLTKSNADFRYTDGNHLWKESGQKVSRIIAEWIYNNEISLTNAQ